MAGLAAGSSTAPKAAPRQDALALERARGVVHAVTIVGVLGTLFSVGPAFGMSKGAFALDSWQWLVGQAVFWACVAAAYTNRFLPLLIRVGVELAAFGVLALILLVATAPGWLFLLFAGLIAFDIWVFRNLAAARRAQKATPAPAATPAP